MNRFLYVAILILVFCASCTDTKKEKLSNLINEWLGKEIFLWILCPKNWTQI